MLVSFVGWLRAALLGLLLGLATTLIVPAVALAHVELDSPNGGQSLTGGSTFTIRWHPTVEHGTIDWDLWYTTEGPDTDNWISIAEDIALGDPTADSLHTFDWTVPNESIAQAWVRVQQDNQETDYTDVSDASFAIVAAGTPGDYNSDGQVDAADYTVWRDTLGSTNLAADGTGDGNVDQDDYTFWHSRFGNGTPTVGNSLSPQLSAVPEPASFLFLLTSGLLAFFRRRSDG